MSDPLKDVRKAIADARACLDDLLGDASSQQRIESVAALLVERLAAGGKVLACGNGGSACDAAHFCEELTGRFRAPGPGEPDRRPLAAIACNDAGHITCTANDYGFEDVFARWVTALARPEDVVIVLSTSGTSENIVRAVTAAHSMGATVVGLLGRDGGRLRGACDHEWTIKAETSDRIQEVHMLILHVLVERVEARMRSGESA